MKIVHSCAWTGYVILKRADWMEARTLHAASARRAASLRSRSVTVGADRMEARA